MNATAERATAAIVFRARNTPACQSVAIMLEACELDYRIEPAEAADREPAIVFVAADGNAQRSTGRLTILSHLAQLAGRFQVGSQSLDQHASEILDQLETDASAGIAGVAERLSAQDYVAGAEITTADFALATAVIAASAEGATTPESVRQWIARLRSRPAFARGLVAIG